MTGQQFIDDALIDLGVIAAGETPSSDERNYSLRQLNQLIDSLSAEALPIPVITRSTVTLTGAASYTLSAQPMKIKAATATANGLATPVKIVPAEEWALGNGAQSEVHLWHDGGTTIYLRPLPTGGTLELYTYAPLTSFASLATDVTFPRGYERAIRRLLGVELAGGFGRPMTEELVQIATDAKMSILGLNSAVLGPPVPVAPQQLPKAA